MSDGQKETVWSFVIKMYQTKPTEDLDDDIDNLLKDDFDDFTGSVKRKL